MCCPTLWASVFPVKTHGHSLEVRFFSFGNGSSSCTATAAGSTGSTSSTSSTSSTTSTGATTSATSSELGGKYPLFFSLGHGCLFIFSSLLSPVCNSVFKFGPLGQLGVFCPLPNSLFGEIYYYLGLSCRARILN